MFRSRMFGASRLRFDHLGKCQATNNPAENNFDSNMWGRHLPTSSLSFVCTYNQMGSQGTIMGDAKPPTPAQDACIHPAEDKNN